MVGAKQRHTETELGMDSEGSALGFYWKWRACQCPEVEGNHVLSRKRGGWSMGGGGSGGWDGNVTMLGKGDRVDLEDT